MPVKVEYHTESHSPMREVVSLGELPVGAKLWFDPQGQPTKVTVGYEMLTVQRRDRATGIDLSVESVTLRGGDSHAIHASPQTTIFHFHGLPPTPEETVRYTNNRIEQLKNGRIGNLSEAGIFAFISAIMEASKSF